ncbi:transcription factor bHLH30-like [Heracleum sosnowskyi]|uniref:Transcription factor bHLH30-like n=1 Tax=Heracleum sosnowskyi TaxID=360622 RepID=A0AAD8H6L5_9APIA|nr:transcription factor bHLH30-like [Heracleum sosnowskyi]
MEFFHSQEFVSNPSFSNICQGQSSLMEILKVGNSNMVTKSTAETTKSMAACKNHSEAERRRRKRINGHLSTLRSLLPNTIKTDKASLLAEVVRRVKELKQTTSELAAAAATSTNGCTRNHNNNNYIKTSNNHDECMMIPSETDELDLFYCDQHYGTIKAVICFEDRPELMSDIISALNSVQAKVVRAEMATIGGRTKIVLWLLHGSPDRDEGLTATRRALVVLMGSPVVMSCQDLAGGKRIRRSHY